MTTLFLESEAFADVKSQVVSNIPGLLLEYLEWRKPLGSYDEDARCDISHQRKLSFSSFQTPLISFSTWVSTLISLVGRLRSRSRLRFRFRSVLGNQSRFDHHHNDVSHFTKESAMQHMPSSGSPEG